MEFYNQTQPTKLMSSNKPTSLTRRIAHNTIIQITGKVISVLLGLVTIAAMTRYLGQVGFGQFTTITAFLQVTIVFIDMGLALMLVQMLSKPNVISSPEGEQTFARLQGNAKNLITEQKLISNFLSLRFLTSLTLLIAATAIAFLIPSYSRIIKLGIAFTTISFLFSSLTSVLTGIFQKHLHLERVAIAEVAGRLFLVGFTFLAIWQNWNLFSILAAVILGNLINFAVLFYFSKKFVRIKPQIDLKIWKNILRQSWPVALSIAFNLVYFKADTIILSLTRPQAEVGIYGATYRVLEITIMFPIMFINLVLPFLTRAWAEKNYDKFKNILQKSFDFLTLTAIPMVTATLILGTKIMTTIAGPDFAPAGPVVKLLIIATAIIFVGGLFSHTIVALDKQKQMLKYYITAAAVGLTGYLILIPRYSYFGAAAITILAELLIAIPAFIIVTKTTKLLPNFGIIYKSITASLIMVIPLYFLKNWNLFLLLIIAGLVYFTTLYFVKGFSKKIILEIVKYK